ncbi:hypothetical protein IEQ34_013503 [Dendrobium chrysotoxum]|uniref:Epidermal patterning factor-like protein n=1 Tax=Dendrobium chrysotoxum TaxID=161865 RepID=A0AAV7GR66_DENCH|nr:hypothetical protein IEQ34_013503 [Dendrobium chrysotoxum]
MVIYFYYTISRSRIINVQLSVLFLLLATANQERFFAQEANNLIQMVISMVAMQEDEGDGRVKESFMIGSSPPRCKGICLNCGPCEAVQVPATPQETKSVAHSNVNINGRGDESSNYKPMNWKYIVSRLLQAFHDWKFHHLILKAHSGGNDDELDQNPLVPSSRAIISLVYLVREGGRPNLTVGSLSAAMSCFG